jgi:hypothetical protein
MTEEQIKRKAEEARKFLATVLATWGDVDIIRLARLCRFGTPDNIVSSTQGYGRAEKGDAPGCTAIRPESSPIESARADVQHAWRIVCKLAGLPLPGPHDIGNRCEWS